MSRRKASRITIPDELRDLLTEFTLSYLTEQPPDVVEYAIEYFHKLQESRDTNIALVVEPLSPDDSLTYSDDEPPPEPGRDVRRESVFTESYNPEEDDDEDAERVVYPKSEVQRSRLEESVKNIFLFRSLDKEQLEQVLDAMFERKVSEGDYIINQGDDGDNFYVIDSGFYKVLISDGSEQKHVFTYENKGSFGELALMYNMPRAATIQATSDGSLWALDRNSFRRILLKTAYRKRMMYEQLIESVPMLKTLQTYERMNLADALVPRRYADGEAILRQGEVADGMYFIEEGDVRFTITDANGVEVEVNRCTTGGYFGELALVTHKPRAATAYAVGDIKVAFLDVDAFERLLGPCIEIMKRNIEFYEEQVFRIFGTKSVNRDTR